MSLYSICRDNGESLYIQIARKLEQEVAVGYGPGDCLPAEGLLAIRFGVNRHTLRRAIDVLVEAGLLERQRGRGVFVLDSQIDYQIGTSTRFTENLSSLGLQSENRILCLQALSATERVAQRLGLNIGDRVFWIETLRTVSGRQLCVISHFIPAERFPDLDTLYRGGSLHQFLADNYGCRLKRTESLVTAVLPQGDDAKLLGMPQNRPVLRVKSVNLDDQDGVPVEYSITRFRADRIQLRINP